MRFFIKVQKNDETAWTVSIHSEAVDREPLITRIVRRSGAGNKVFPQPPADELAEINPKQPHYDLCRAAETERLFELYASIISKDLADKDMATFGRYLFSTLIGAKAWAAICQKAGDQTVELALVWPQSETVLHRLPWEAMHSGRDFLAAEWGRGAITRVVAGTKSDYDQITIQPRVLFVVGTNINETSVRAGTEFLSLLHRLRNANLMLDTKIVDRVSTEDLEREISLFQPSVVHFICHGKFEQGRAYLEMMPDKTGAGPVQVFAETLLRLLRAGKQTSPPIVVLNACYSATSRTDAKSLPLSIPLSIELVQGGVPMVIGMAGRIADRACRLFTTRFYETLLNGGSVAEATAEGRFAGIKHMGEQAERLTDWAMPIIYLAEGLSTSVTVDPNWAEQTRKRLDSAAKYRSLNNPKIFCDRQEIFTAYRALMADQTQKSLLIVEADEYETKLAWQRPQYGKTRLLEEIAAQSVLDGHIACLLSYNEQESPPATALDIAIGISRALRKTRERFKLNSNVSSEVVKLHHFIKNQAQANDLNINVRTALELDDPDSASVVREALALDLTSLLDEARAKFDSASLKILILIDEVHRFDTGARVLVEELINEEGLGKEGQAVPVILTFTSCNLRPEYNTAINQLKEFLSKGRLYAARQYLRAFPPPNDDILIYQQFLLHREPPLIAREPVASMFFDRLHSTTRGVPSMLCSDELEVAISTALDFKGLEEADDEALLRRLIEQERERERASRG